MVYLQFETLMRTSVRFSSQNAFSSIRKHSDHRSLGFQPWNTLSRVLLFATIVTASSSRRDDPAAAAVVDTIDTLEPALSHRSTCLHSSRRRRFQFAMFVLAVQTNLAAAKVFVEPRLGHCRRPPRVWLVGASKDCCHQPME